MKGSKCPKCSRFTLHEVYQKFFGEAINYHRWVKICSNCGYSEGIKKDERPTRW